MIFCAGCESVVTGTNPLDDPLNDPFISAHWQSEIHQRVITKTDHPWIASNEKSHGQTVEQSLAGRQCAGCHQDGGLGHLQLQSHRCDQQRLDGVSLVELLDLP
jgi:hypothetical protein